MFARHAPFKLLLRSIILVGVGVIGTDRVLTMDVEIEMQRGSSTQFVHNRQRPAFGYVTCRHPRVWHAHAIHIGSPETLSGQTVTWFVTMRDHNSSLNFVELAVATPQSKEQAGANETPGSCNAERNSKPVCFGKQCPHAYGSPDEARHTAKQHCCASQNTSNNQRAMKDTLLAE